MLTLDDGQPLEIETNHPRGGLAMTFDLSGEDLLQTSPVWHSGGWRVQFLRLAPNQSLILPFGDHLLKVILGHEVSHDLACFANDQEVRSLWLTSKNHSTDQRNVATKLVAGEQGLLAALFTETPDVTANIFDMSDLTFTGPQSECLTWHSFKDRFGAATAYFDDLDNHMADGFHLADSSGGNICYVNFWSCGIGGDVSTHNHAHTPNVGSPAFAEVHMVLNNAGGRSGMYLASELAAPTKHGVGTEDASATEERFVSVMQRGDEHGPYFFHDGDQLQRLANGAIAYPWHGWESRGEALSEPAFDYVVAFEIYPEFVEFR